MPASKISKDDLKRHLSEKLTDYTLVGPVKSRLAYKFDVISNVDRLEIEYTTTVLPPKKQFMPTVEPLIRFQGDGTAQLPLIPTDRPVALVALHSCDLIATDLIDTIFATAPGDPYYKTRRENAVILGVRCMEPCDTHAFCNAMGTLDQKGGADIFLTPLDHHFLVEPLSKKGETFLAGAALSHSGDEDAQAVGRIANERDKQFRSQEKVDLKALSDAMTTSRDHEIWDELAGECLACGTCNITCPTCYCFDMCDKMELSLVDGERRRSWDSCQLREFAEVAGGENFRGTRADRQRHRFFRKGKYLFDRYDLTGCVGCGRCVRQCVADIDPLEVYQRLLERRSARV